MRQTAASSSPVQVPNDAGAYSVIVTNACGSVASSNAVLTVNPPPAFSSGLVAYYPFNGNANDLSTNGNNGTPHNAVLTTDRFCVSGHAYQFNGTDAYVSAPNQSYLSFPNGEFTISLWAAVEGAPNPIMYLVGLDNGNDAGAQKWIFFYGQLNIPYPPLGDYVGFHVNERVGGDNYWLATTEYAPALSSWHQHIITQTGTNYTVYIDGASVFGETNYMYNSGTQVSGIGGPPTIPSGITAPLTIGEAEGGGYFHGKLDDIRIYSRALSPVEVLQLYQAERSPVPDVILQPQSQTVTVGQPAAFSVSTTTCPPPTYQWRFNGLGISDATNSIYTIASAVTGDAGSYDVVITNTAGSVTSAAAVLTVNKTLATVALGDLNRVCDGTPKCATFSTTPPGLLVILTYDGSTNCPSAVGSYTVVGTITDANYQGSATNTLVIQPVLPFFAQQPQSQSVPAGTNVTFSVTAGGTPPLAYQWRKDAAAIGGATNSSHSITAVLAGDAGGYDVVVTSPYGSATSTVATLTVNEAPISRVFVVSTNGMSGGVIVVPVNLSALGNENALGFSLTYDATKLSFQSAQLGATIAGSSLFINPSFTNIGRLGIAVSQPSGVSFSAGTQEVVRISFLAQPVTNTISAIIAFADVPTGRQLVDALANILPATYAAGTVTMTPVDIPPMDYEADVSPRPDGDHALTIADWVLVGRFVAGLDAVTNDNELLRADCAPRANLGNGHLTVTDWVQAGRYAVGLDPVTVVGGPTAGKLLTSPAPGAEGFEAEDADPARTVQMGSLSGQPDQTINVPVLLHALGDENALGFSVAFDPALLDFSGAEPGTGAAGASFNLNAAAAGQGKVGVLVAQSPGGLFAAGTQQVAVLRFAIRREATNDAEVTFSDSPVVQEVSDANANVLSISYIDGQVSISSLPVLRIWQQGANVVISWPAPSGAFRLQSADTPSSGSWNPVALEVVTNGARATVTVPATNTHTYFRLQGN